MREILKSEMIGLTAQVTASKNKADEGISGLIVDETKKTLKILTKRGEKVLLKSNITITAMIDGKKTKIDCSRISLRPEERIKKSR